LASLLRAAPCGRTRNRCTKSMGLPMFAAVGRVKQSSGVSGTCFGNRNNAGRWRFHRSINLIIAAESKANFRVEKAHNRQPLSGALYRPIGVQAPGLSTIRGSEKMRTFVIEVPRN